MATLLLVDDDESMREVTGYHLSKAGYHVLTAANGIEAMKLITRHNPDLVICDLMMPGMDGEQLLREARNFSEDIKLIMITAHGSIESAVEAIKIGACEYIEKPFSSEALKLSVEKALKLATLERENRYLRKISRENFLFKNIVGSSKKMREVFNTAGRVAPKDTTVLLLGESGTGKEVLAKAIHFKSSRSRGPFITVNMGAVPEELIDSELFGHEKGAFTGAISRRTGAFEQAEGGTIFLDEIAEMKMSHQVRLLRVLQEREICRLGSEGKIKVNVRVIAATNQNLEKMIIEKEFREDLYYRLYVMPITLPPLRERREDIPLLAEFFLKKISVQFGEGELRMNNEAKEALVNYRWPGNIRELENAIERIAVTISSEVITLEEIPEKYRERVPSQGATRFEIPEEGLVLEELEKEILLSALEKKEYNQSAAARLIGITRTSLIRRMKKYEIESDGL